MESFLSGSPSSFSRCGGGENASRSICLKQLEPNLHPHSRQTVACGIAICLCSNLYLHHAVNNSRGRCLGGCPAKSGTVAFPLQDGQNPWEGDGGGHQGGYQLSEAAPGSVAYGSGSYHSRNGLTEDGPGSWGRAVAAYWSSTTGHAARGPPATSSGRSELDRKMALLTKRQAALNTALQQGRENPVDRAIESSRLL